VGRVIVLAVALAIGVVAGIELAVHNSARDANSSEAARAILSELSYAAPTTPGALHSFGPAYGRPDRVVRGFAVANDARASVSLILYSASDAPTVSLYELTLGSGASITRLRDASVCDAELQSEEQGRREDPRFDKALALLKARC
jgi:hypothetical protein